MKKQPIRIFQGELTQRYYAVTQYKELDNGQFQAISKQDVTADIERLLGGQQSSFEAHVTNLVRLASEGKIDDLKMYARRIARRVRSSNPKLSKQLYALVGPGSILRKDGHQ